MPNNIYTQYKVNCLTVCSNAEQASIYAARKIAEVILQRQKDGKSAVLGLATGKTPIKVYEELIRLHKNEGLSFENVISFNLDEYYPIRPESNQSYSFFMRHHLFDHIDINLDNTHIPHADCPPNRIHEYCMAYEEKIKSYGGLDLQLLGIGRNGHIGFNEPGSSFKSTTRLVDLHSLTRKDAESDFGTIDRVPYQAISVGIHTIVQARKIILLALGKDKSEIVNKAVKGQISTEIPASLLQTISQVEYILDPDSAQLIQD